MIIGFSQNAFISIVQIYISLAKAFDILIFCPPDESGGNSNLEVIQSGGNSFWILFPLDKSSGN